MKHYIYVKDGSLPIDEIEDPHQPGLFYVSIEDDDLAHIDEKYPKPTYQKGISMTIIEVRP